MTAGELSRRIGGTLIAANADNEISRGMVCDMLCHAMLNGVHNMAGRHRRGYAQRTKGGA